MKSKYEYTIEELIALGAQIRIYFHGNENMTEANEKMELFDDVGEIESYENNGTYWLKSNGDVEVIAFYKGDE